jgi:hypothetical protein
MMQRLTQVPIFLHLFFACLTLTLAYQASPAYNLTTRGVALVGFHAEEHDKERAFRWTGARATLGFAGIGQRPYQLTLTVSGARPAGMELPKVRVFANAQPIATFKPTRNSRDYTFDVPAAFVHAVGALDVQLESDTFAPPNDFRTLGVMLYDARLAPSDTPFTVPAPMTLVWVGITLILLHSALQRLRAPPVIIHGLCAALWLVASIGVASERLLTVAALPWLVFVSTLAYALTRRNTGKQEHGEVGERR